MVEKRIWTWKRVLQRVLQWLLMLQLAVPLGLVQSGVEISDNWKGFAVLGFFVGFLWMCEG